MRCLRQRVSHQTWCGEGLRRYEPPGQLRTFRIRMNSKEPVEKLLEDSAATVDLRWRDRSGSVRRERVRLEAGVWTILLAGGGRS